MNPTLLFSFVAFAAPIVNTVQMLPQLHKIYTTESIAGLSQYMIILALTTNILWTLHGVYLKDKALIVAGVLASLINILIIEKYYRILRTLQRVQVTRTNSTL
jgi:MtN3 and saliva related transmembrane protein